MCPTVTKLKFKAIYCFYTIQFTFTLLNPAFSYIFNLSFSLFDLVILGAFYSFESYR